MSRAQHPEECAVGKLDGKVAFITGAGAGIAKAASILFAREGARVAVIELSPEAGSGTEQSIRAQGAEALFLQTDVTDADQMARAVDRTVERFGRLDVLVNCAGGSTQQDHPVHEMDLAVWHQTIALNLLHPFLACKYGIPHMIESGGGSIVNFASSLGMVGSAKPAYAAAKGGVVAFTRTLAAQYAQHRIRANAIAPGLVRSERQMRRWLDPKATKTSAQRSYDQLMQLYPFSVSEPEQIAALALFLASEDSGMITGATINADGGKSSYLKVI
jgi:NAD(P)-dependent dehydrogenase (short-subunit alcohol dehydrogenase family)